MPFVLISFASSNLVGALERVSSQATEIGVFDSIVLLTENDLDPAFRDRFKHRLTIGTRGYGYWSWKPQIIGAQLARMADDDVLLWLDAGCHLDPRGGDKLLDYCAQLDVNRPIGAFRAMGEKSNSTPTLSNQKDHNLTNEAWTKEDLFRHFEIAQNDPIRRQPQFFASAVLIRNCPKSRQFVEDWKAPFQEDWSLVDDSRSTTPNAPTFVENRHDQSVFSLLCYLNEVVAIPGDEMIGALGWEADIAARPGIEESGFPIQARRDKTQSRKGYVLRRWNRLKRSIGKRLQTTN